MLWDISSRIILVIVHVVRLFILHVVDLYSSILDDVGLKVLMKTLDDRESKSIPTESLIEQAEFLFEKIYSNLMTKLNI